MTSRDPIARAPTVSHQLDLAAERYGARRAVVHDDEAVTFSEVRRRAAAVAAQLTGMRLRPGDRVALWAPNGIDWIVAYYGVLRAGLVISPLNYLLTAEEVAYAVADCGARLLIAGAEKSATVAQLRGRGDTTEVILAGAGGDPSLPALAAATAGRDLLPAVDLDPEALAAILYTSGTTGRPKGAMITHRALLLNAALTAQMHARHRDDVVVSALPLPHVYGAAVLNTTLLTGACLVLHTQFREREILAAIERHRATMFEGVPTMYHYLMACPELPDHDISSLTRCTVGGQTMPVAKMQEVERRLGCPLIELWGMTELGGLGATHASWATPKQGSIGVALPHMHTRIAAADAGQPDPATGEVGELCIRGPLVMQGYFGNPGATAEAIDSGGWLHTGDLARQDAEGYVYVVDRKKDMILTAGYNVYPAEIERVIAAHPAVAMVAVGKMADETKGELAKAYVVLRPGAVATADQIVAYCRDQLAAYKLPREVQFVSDLPKTSTGKILRRELRSLDASGAITS